MLFGFRSFDRGLQYAKRGSHYKNPKSVRQVLEYPWFRGLSIRYIYFKITICCVVRRDAFFCLVETLTRTLGLSQSMVSQKERSESKPLLVGTLFRECIFWSYLWICLLQICVIADVCPETAEEVFALVPSLKVCFLNKHAIDWI